MGVDAALRSAWEGYRDWAGYVMNPRFVRKNGEITWSGSERPFLREPVCAADVVRMIEGEAFSLQVQEDEAVLQFWYRFGADGVRLEQARLAYYATGPEDGWREQTAESAAWRSGSPGEVDDELTPESSATAPDQDRAAATERERNLVAGGADGRVAWLRVDYAPRSLPDPLHHCCHLHLGGFRNGRIALSRVPSPRQFLEWVFALRYPESYRAHRLNDRNGYRDARIPR